MVSVAWANSSSASISSNCVLILGNSGGSGLGRVGTVLGNNGGSGLDRVGTVSSGEVGSSKVSTISIVTWEYHGCQELFLGIDNDCVNIDLTYLCPGSNNKFVSYEVSFLRD